MQLSLKRVFMARFLENIGERWGLWLDTLTDRERRLIFIFCFSLSVFLILGILFGALSRINHKSMILKQNQDRLAQIKELTDDYNKAKKQMENAKLKIKKNRVSLFSLISSVTNKLGLSVKDLSEQKRPIPKTEIVEISVKLNLTKLSIDRLTALIEAIETSEEGGDLVKVTKIKINKRFDDPESLDLQMTVATFKNA